MRVTIEHREQTAGIAGNNRNYFVDCRVDFSEEEKAIIKARDLYRRGFEVPADMPLPPPVSYFGTGIIRFVGRLLILGGAGLGIVGAFAGWHNVDHPTFFAFLAGIAIEIYGWLRGRRQERRLDNPEQEITLRRLLSQPHFTVSVSDPAEGKRVEEDIRSYLTRLKELIKGSAELNKPSSFEL